MFVQYVFLPSQQAETYLAIYVLINQCPTSSVKNCHVQFSGSSRKFLIQKYTKMTAVDESDSSLAAKCLDICQVLAGQGLAFNFSLSIGSNFSFSLDARGKGQALATQGKTKKKKKTPSTLRRNAIRRSEFLKKKLDNSGTNC